MSPADERAKVVHDLAEVLTAAFANCGPLRDELAILKGAAPALIILGDISTCLRRAVDLFPTLRKVM